MRGAGRRGLLVRRPPAPGPQAAAPGARPYRLTVISTTSGACSPTRRPRMLQRLADGEMARDPERRLVRAERVGAGTPQHHPDGHHPVPGQAQLLLDARGRGREEARQVPGRLVRNPQPLATSKTKPSAAGSKSTVIPANCGAQFCRWCSTRTPRSGYGGNRGGPEGGMPQRCPARVNGPRVPWCPLPPGGAGFSRAAFGRRTG